MRREQQCGMQKFEHDNKFQNLIADQDDHAEVETEPGEEDIETPPGLIKYRKSGKMQKSRQKGQRGNDKWKHSTARNGTGTTTLEQQRNTDDAKTVNEAELKGDGPTGRQLNSKMQDGCPCSGPRHSWKRRCEGSKSTEDPKSISCCMRGPTQQREDQEEHERKLQTQINEPNEGKTDSGQWELLTITVDSGAGESVSPPDVATSFPIIETKASQEGVYYVAATGDRIYNEGEKRVTCTTQEGHRQSWMFQIAEVNKVLASVSRICESGRHKVVFQKGDSFIEDVKTGQRTQLRERTGVYVIEAWIDRSDFARQGATP